MRLNLFVVVALAAGISLSLPAFANQFAKIDCKTLYNELWAHSLEAMKARERETDYFYWGRARLAIEATPNEALERIFSRMSKKDLEELFWGIKSGEIPATREEDKMVEELWHMVDDLGAKTFWGPTNDRGYTIRQALRAHDAKLSYSGDPAFAAEMTDKALGKTELEVMSRALAEHEKNAKFPNSKWYDRMVRFFSPHYDKVKTVLETNNSIRRRLQKMYEMDKPALEAIPKYKDSLGLTNDELRELQTQVSDTAAQLNEARQDVLNLYGREVSTQKPLPAAEVRVRELAKKAKTAGSENKELDLTTTAEADMDAIDRVIGQAWNRKNGVKTGMPVEEKNDVHLQIRNPQYRRETPERRAAYLDVTESRSPNQASYNVETEWTVTVQHAEPKTRIVTKTVYNEKGEATGTTLETEHYTDYYSTTYTRSREDVLKARYEEVLRNNVDPSSHIDDLPALPYAEPRGAYATSASNGSPSIASFDTNRINWILEQGRQARASETPYRDQIARATNLVDGVSNEKYKEVLKKPGEAAKILKALQQEEASLRETRAKLGSYQAQDASAVQRQWTHDQPKDFKDRNQQMIQRYDHMINRIVHLAEQVRRESPSLTIEYNLPTYEPQLARLEEIKKKNKKIIVRTGVGATTAAVGTSAYIYRNELMSGIRELTGHAPEEPHYEKYYREPNGQ